MKPTPTQCLILACGNPLREDDGVGPWLAGWAQERFYADPRLRVLAAQQWTPELAEDIAAAAAVLFVDCSSSTAPGAVLLSDVSPRSTSQGLATHHLGASELLALALELFGHAPQKALLLTVGAASLDLREGFSAEVEAALPRTCRLLEDTVLSLVAEPKSM
jgi:hydrogenase maturation protease